MILALQTAWREHRTFAPLLRATTATAATAATPPLFLLGGRARIIAHKMGVVYAFSFANSERSMTPMRFDDHRKIVGTGFNTDPRDATEPDGRHAGIPFVVGARRVFSAVAGTDQDVHSYVFMLQVDKHERCSLEVLLAMPDWASISGDGSVHQEASANSDAYSAAVMQERSLAFVREVVLGASNRTCGRGMHCTCSSCCRKRYHLQRRDAQSSAVCKDNDAVFVTPHAWVL